MSKPLLTIIAGSNGSGKSTLTSVVRDKFQLMPVLDPDSISKLLKDSITTGLTDIEAGKQVLRRAYALLSDRQSFTVETTLSGSTYLRMADTAKAAGFDVCVIFIGTSSVEINLRRVKVRVIKGGHDVPETDQRRRYPRTLINMTRLIRRADFAVVLDNSGEEYVLVGFKQEGHIHWNEPVPAWAESIYEAAKIAIDPAT